MNKLIVVIVLYKSMLEDFERKNVRLMFKYLRGYKWYIVIPENSEVEIPFDEKIEFNFIRFPDILFQSISGYNKLLLSPRFYQYFNKITKYLLIIQPDVTIVKNFDENILDNDIVYYGARWDNPLQLYPVVGRRFSRLLNLLGLSRFSKWRVIGNGGLSIRRVADFVNATSKLHARLWMDSEDLYFAFQWDLSYLAENMELKDYFIEFQAREKQKIGLEFGYHALDKNNPKFLENIFNSHNEF